MKDYFRWSLRQLYLLACGPTQFNRECKIIPNTGDVKELSFKIARRRIRYILKMLPWMIAFAVIANWITGNALGIAFNWGASWRGMAVGVMGGIVVGVMGGEAIGLAVGVAGSVAGSVAGGVELGVAITLALGVAIGLAVNVTVIRAEGEVIGMAGGVVGGIVGGGLVGLAFSLVLGVTFSGAGGMAVGVAVGLVFGLAFSLVLGVTFSEAVGVAVGVAVGLVFGVAGSVAGGVAVGVAYAITFWLIYFRLAFYPFDLLLSMAAYFAATRQPHLAEQAWRWCPVAWNEVIWLPLPFVAKLLALLAKQDREEGFRQIALVVAERKLQGRAARAALVHVALDDLYAASVDTLVTVADKLNWTTDAPADLPEELKTALPRFDRVAQHAGQYCILHNQYRKREALNSALTEIESLQRSLIIVRRGNAPRLLQTANEWRRLLNAEREHIQSHNEIRREIPNPFVFGNPVREPQHNLFSGRRDIVKQIEASILGAQQAPTLLLYGPRRMGKTSILHQLPRLLGPNFAPAIVDCQNPAVTASAASLLRYLSRAISNGLRGQRVQINPLTVASIQREPFSVFDDWLDAAERAMPESLRVLLCLDEYERLGESITAGWGAAVLDQLRHILQHRPRWVLMFTGAHTFAELGPAWTDRFISARRVRVSFLTREELLPLLTEPVPEFDMTYAPGALDAILDATNGQPFLTQAIAFELVQLLNEAERKQAMLPDIEQAIQRALISGGEYFANVWSDADADGQAILRAIIKNEPPPDFPVARQWLREHDVLNDAGQFAVPMVRRWVQEKIA